jgi:hypothetical protein
MVMEIKRPPPSALDPIALERHRLAETPARAGFPRVPLRVEAASSLLAEWFSPSLSQANPKNTPGEVEEHLPADPEHKAPPWRDQNPMG